MKQIGNVHDPLSDRERFEIREREGGGRQGEGEMGFVCLLVGWMLNVTHAHMRVYLRDGSAQTHFYVLRTLR